jgi:parallel beta-helix repeat protein
MARLSSEFQIQEYVFHEVLGQGTFGITYRCTDEGLHSNVAIKEYFLKGFTQRQQDGTLIPVTEADDSSFNQGLEMFCREAQTLERLKHPNVVNVRRVFKHNGTAYIVMDYYSGRDLQHWLEEHPEPLTEMDASTLLEPIFDALTYIHDKGFVHRDIKPSNILLHDPAEGGPLEPILLDFGAARDFLAPNDLRTIAVFTEGYAPIEQYSKHAERGPFTDIYACGALFYRLVTGEQPPSALDRAQGTVLSFERFSSPVAQIVAKAMASSATDRYQTMPEFVAVLQAALNAAELGVPKLTLPASVVDTRVRLSLTITAPDTRSIVITAPKNGALRGENASAFAVTNGLPLSIGAGESAELEVQCVAHQEDIDECLEKASAEQDEMCTLRAQLYLISSDPESPKLFYELLAPVHARVAPASATKTSSRAPYRPRVAAFFSNKWLADKRLWGAGVTLLAVLLVSVVAWYVWQGRELETPLVTTAEALEDALARARAGSTIRVAAGEYQLDDTLTSRDSLTVTGAGADRTRIIADVADGEDALWQHEDGILTLNGVMLVHEGTGRALELESGGLVLAQSRILAAQAGVWLAPEVQQVRIRSSDLSATNGTALQVMGASDISIDSSTLHSSRMGIWAEAGLISGRLVRLEQNEVGVKLTGSSRLELSDSVLSRNTRAGLYGSGFSEAILQQVDASEQPFGALVWQDARLDISSSVWRNHDTAIAVLARADVTLQNTTLQRNTWGLVARPATAQVLDNVTLTDNRAAGVAPVVRQLGGIAPPLLPWVYVSSQQAASAVSPAALLTILDAWFAGAWDGAGAAPVARRLVSDIEIALLDNAPVYASPSTEAEVVANVALGSRHTLLAQTGAWWRLEQGWLPRQYGFPLAALGAENRLSDALTRASGTITLDATLDAGVYRLPAGLAHFGELTLQGAGTEQTLLLVDNPLRYFGGRLTLRDITVATTRDGAVLEVIPWEVSDAHVQLERSRLTRVVGTNAGANAGTNAGINAGTNTAAGVVLAKHASLTVVASTIDHHSDGINASGSSQVTVRSSRFSNNQTGINLQDDASLEVRVSAFTDNSSAAIYQASNNEITLQDTTFDGLGILRALRDVDPNSDLAALVADLPAGSGVRLPAGEFRLDATLVIDKALTLVGSTPVTEAATAADPVTRLVSSAEDAVLRFTADDTLTLQNIWLEHDGRQRADVVVVDSGELVLRGSRLQGARSNGLLDVTAGGAGVRWQGAAGGGIVSDSVFINNTGFALVVGGQAAPRIVQSTLTGNGGGVLFAGAARGVLQDSNLRRNGAVGVQIAGAAQPVIEGNTIFDHNFNGLAYLDSAAGTARRNLIDVSGEAGIDVRGQATPLLENNTISSSYRGIFYTANGAGTARANRLRSNRGYGIYLATNAEPLLEDNTFEGNTPGDIYTPPTAP